MVIVSGGNIFKKSICKILFINIFKVDSGMGMIYVYNVGCRHIINLFCV